VHELAFELNPLGLQKSAQAHLINFEFPVCQQRVFHLFK